MHHVRWKSVPSAFCSMRTSSCCGQSSELHMYLHVVCMLSFLLREDCSHCCKAAPCVYLELEKLPVESWRSRNKAIRKPQSSPTSVSSPWELESPYQLSSAASLKLVPENLEAPRQWLPMPQAWPDEYFSWVTRIFPSMAFSKATAQALFSVSLASWTSRSVDSIAAFPNVTCTCTRKTMEC